MSKIKFVGYAESVCPETHVYYGKDIDPNIEQYSVTSLIKKSRERVPENEFMREGTRRHEELQKLILLEQMTEDPIVKDLYRQFRSICTGVPEFEVKMVCEYEGVYIVGSADILTKRTMYEIKTGKTKSNSHLLQLEIYLYMLSLDKGSKRAGWVVYPDSSKPVHWSSATESKIISLLEAIQKEEGIGIVEVEDTEIEKLCHAKWELSGALKDIERQLTEKLKDYNSSKKYKFGGVLLQYTESMREVIDKEKLEQIPEQYRQDLYKQVNIVSKRFKNLNEVSDDN